MWVEYKSGIYNTDTWKTIHLFEPAEFEGYPTEWVVVLNDDIILYKSHGEALARKVYTKFKSTLCVKNKIKIES